MRQRDSFASLEFQPKTKFLDKKKKQKGSRESSIQQNNAIIKIQKNIRRFFELHIHQTVQIQQPTDLFLASQELLLSNPHFILQFFQSSCNSLILRKKMFAVSLKFLMKAENEGRVDKDLPSEIIHRLLVNLQTYKHLFKILSRRQKNFFIHKVLTKSEESPLWNFQEENRAYIMKEIPNDFNNFIFQLSQNSALAFEFLLVNETNFIMREYEGKFPQMVLINAYTNLQKRIVQLNYLELRNRFFVQILKLLIKRLIEQLESNILESHQLSRFINESDEEEIKEFIHEKEEWVTFIDFLSLRSNFFQRIIYFFIENEKKENIHQQIFDLVSIVVQNMPPEHELKYNIQTIEKLFNKLVNQIKVHLIESDIDQQRQLLPTFLILQKFFSQMGDYEFYNMFQERKKDLERLIKNNFMKILAKIIFIVKPTKYSHKISKLGVKLLQNLYNKSFRTKIINTDSFVNEFLTQKFVKYNFNNTNDEIDLFIRNFPFIFPLILRLRKFRNLSKSGQYYYNEEENPGKVVIRRNHEFQDAFKYLHNKNLKIGFGVVFINELGLEERGIDAGGLIKQFINRVLKVIFKQQFGMFVQNHERELIPHPTKAENSDEVIVQYYEFIGKIMGKALLEGITIGPKFSGPFLNALIGKKNSFEDLWKIDSKLYKSLVMIKNMEDDARDLELTFEYKDEERKKYVNLKPYGAKIKVTNENKNEYVNLLANYKVNKLLEYQSRHIRKGLTKVINQEWLFMFNYEQLNYLISGAGEINIEELRKFTRYGGGYNIQHKTIISFWRVVFDFNEEEKANLLMFVTSCPRPSFLGFEDLSPPFTIIRNHEGLDSLPISHTCGNVLELPDYQEEGILRTKLLIAINSKSGFELA